MGCEAVHYYVYYILSAEEAVYRLSYCFLVSLYLVSQLVNQILKTFMGKDVEIKIRIILTNCEARFSMD
ncbi:hypothetical protein EUGRSUZ_F03387 [Eucalyptus grandis]|uniref:Uncharacterized protein n=2 Tax=Eucalyptus grandis TaxID=71139 RepID=A0ACC3KM49_EUCGR|nr:hypothetical protein EUGRSUZ_F03387 [Eucalyptus grandis]